MKHFIISLILIIAFSFLTPEPAKSIALMFLGGWQLGETASYLARKLVD